MTIWITTNGRLSNGAKALASQPGFKRCIKGAGLEFEDVLVNWGSTKDIKTVKDCARVWNYTDPVSKAADKLKCFQMLKPGQVPTPEWTTNRVDARIWSQEGATVVVRHKLSGHSGDGIEIVEPGQEVPEAPLYTKYIFKDKEFRVHVVGDKIVDTQRKIKDPNKEVVTWKVRSHANGFMYVRGNIAPDEARDSLASDAIDFLGLHFGAVDIIQDKHGKYYVLEVNTAPGLEGKTVELYAEAFREYEKLTNAGE